jgi:V/A-type H+/Na+-transporting ATPase subunit E
MANDSTNQVKALQDAIIKRARVLTEEHVSQGQMTRARMMEDARAKVKLMEQKELLAANENAEREFQRRVQANEIKLQASLDRHRWGLVQSVMDKVHQQVVEIAQDRNVYDPIFNQLLAKAAAELAEPSMVAKLNHRDRKNYASSWKQMTEKLGVNVQLSEELCECSGGLRLMSEDGSMMIDNTFEGIISRREDELLRTIFERLFSKVLGIEATTHG